MAQFTLLGILFSDENRSAQAKSAPLWERKDIGM